jgi:hypothetical protein
MAAWRSDSDLNGCPRWKMDPLGVGWNHWNDHIIRSFRIFPFVHLPTFQSAWAWTTLGALVAALARALHPVPLVKQHVSGLPKGEKKGNLEIIR